MYAKTITALIIGTGLFYCAISPALEANPDACKRLSVEQVGAALGVAVGAGQHPPSLAGGSGNLRICQWHEAGKSGFEGKMVQIDIMGQMGSMSPVDRFNNAKQPVPRINKTPVEGVGDDAYYIENPAFTSINVRRGTSAFELHVRGVPAPQLKPMLKTLAQQAAAKL